MSLLSDLMDEMRDTIAAVVLTESEEIQVVGRLNLEPTGLSIDIYPGNPFGGENSAAFGEEEGEVFFTVRARVATADSDAWQDVLLDLMDSASDLSIATALMEDQTLSGYASSVLVTGPTGYQGYGDNPGVMLGCEWGVQVLRVFS